MTYSRNIPRFYVFVALNHVMFWTPIWIVFLQRRGLSLSQIGALDAVAWVLIAAAEAPTGVVADTWGRKWSMLIGALIHALSMFALLAEVLSPVFLIGYFAWGVSSAFLSGAQDAFVYDSLRADGRAAAYTHVASRWSIVVQAANAGGALAGGLIAAWDLRAPFVISAIALFGALGVGLTFREPPTSDEAGHAPSGYWHNLRAGISIAVSRPRVRYVLLYGALLLLFPFILSFNLFQPYADEVGLPVWTFGALMLGMRGAAMLGSWLAPAAARRARRETLLIVCPAAIVVCHMLLYALASPPALAFLAAIGLVAAVLRPVTSAMLNDSIPSGQRATIISLQSLLFTLLTAVVNPSLFALGDRTSIAFAIGVSGILMALLTIPVLFLLFRLPRVPAPQAQPAPATDA